MEESNDGAGFFRKPKNERKKSLSKDLKSALKSKRKVAHFMDQVEKSDQEIGALSAEKSDDDLSDQGDYYRTWSDQSVNAMEMDGMTLDDLTFVSNEDAEDIEDADENGPMTLPYMRDFDTGIQYRKLNCNSVLVSIEPFKSLYFAGKALIQVVKGVVDIYGYRLGVDGKKYTVFSAKGHSSLVCVKAIARNHTENETVTSFQDETSGVSLEELASAQGALIIMEGFENEWCEGIRHTYPEAADMVGPSITGIGPGKLPLMKSFMDKLGFQFIKSSRTDKYKFMDFPAYWDDIFNDLTNQFDCAAGKICPFGGKGVGKSTFVKWLSNRFLCQKKGAEVLFIDLDPGQSEFTPPGMISVHVCSEPILGPNFTHLKDADRAVYLGTISIVDQPISYIKGVAELHEYCVTNERFRRIPWIINTMGFSQGLGVHLACEVIKIFRPNCVIQLNIDNNKRSFPFFLNQTNVSKHRTFLSKQLASKYREPLEEYNFLSVKSACNRDAKANMNVWGSNARTMREMVLISYFAEKIGSVEGFSIRSVIPLKVPLDSVAIGTISSNLGYDEIIDVLNGNLVALCEMSDAHFQVVDGTQKRFITNAASETNNCLGYGIVRAFDKQAETLYIITPVNETDILLKVNVILAAGSIGMPMQFYANPAEVGNATEVPYLLNRHEGTSTLHSATKKFFVPKRVTHNVLKNCLL